MTAVNQAGVSVDDADYGVDGTFYGIAAGALFLSVHLTARNTAHTTSFSAVTADPTSTAQAASQNVGVN